MGYNFKDLKKPLSKIPKLTDKSIINISGKDIAK